MEVTLSLTPEQWETVKAAVPEGVGFKVKVAGKRVVTYPDQFEKFWSIYPRKDAKSAAYGCWNARISEKSATSEDLIKAAKNYRDWCEQEGTQQHFIKLPATFLGTNERWKPYLQPWTTKEIQFEGNARHYRP
jgi:hypothetical protein